MDYCKAAGTVESPDLGKRAGETSPHLRALPKGADGEPGDRRLVAVREAQPANIPLTTRDYPEICVDRPYLEPPVVTSPKRAEQDTRHANAELTRVDRMSRMGELTASIVHEISQPLTAILSNAQAARRYLASDAPDLAVVREILDDIIRDDKRAGAVMHHLRLLFQKEQVPLETVNVNEVIREVLELLHSEVVGRGGAVRLELAAKPPLVSAGRVEIQQVLMNLLLNALDAMGDLPRERRALTIRTRDEQGDIVVAVRDNGCGLPSSGRDNLFEPFFTTKPSGLGMGLAICRRMIRSHGGRIWAANNEDAGATFSFGLPAVRIPGAMNHA